MITLWLVRHGMTDWNAEKRYQGQTDVPLNALGEEQAQKIAGRLASERLHAVVSCDLSRTRTIAQKIAVHHPRVKAVQVEPDLREAHFGVFEGLRYKDVMAQYPQMAEAWFADPDMPPQGGERLSDVADRIHRTVDALLAQHTRGQVAIVGHDGALRLVLTYLLEMPTAQYWRFNMDAGSITRVNVYPGGAILVRLNDVGHL